MLQSPHVNSITIHKYCFPYKNMFCMQHQAKLHAANPFFDKYDWLH